MSIENLLKAASFVERIPEEKFYMGLWRAGDQVSLECDGLGDAIGHLTELFPEYVRRDSIGEILFETFADLVFEIENDSAFMWCFAAEWAGIDDTPSGCAYRMRYLAEEGESAAAEMWIQAKKDYKIK